MIQHGTFQLRQHWKFEKEWVFGDKLEWEGVVLTARHRLGTAQGCVKDFGA